MITNVYNQQNFLTIDSTQVQKLAEQVIHAEGQTCDEVNVYFVDTATICKLHAQFFDDPSPTDCISFPMDEEEADSLSYRILGEIFVCPETAHIYAKQHALPVYTELTLYVVHGLLHLMGYDDQEEEDCLKMRQAEARHLALLYSQDFLLNS